METIKKYYRVNRRDIGYIKFILEACEGLAVVSSDDAKTGLLKFSVAPGCEDEFEAVMEGLKQEMMIEKWD